ncbi:two pore domain potassium channel family protein [Clostridium botulinum]|nr:two pore domain potassium channel family protein [Clostridium botulinum]NFO22792.1 two pore domain potassium channel family protein [Clostridium botulinum]
MCSMIYYIDFPRGQDKFKLVNSDEGLLFFDFIYYSVVTFTTLGYGDIIPIS